MPSTWISPDDLLIVIPQSAQDIWGLEKDIRLLARLVGHVMASDWFEHLLAHPQGLLLFYLKTRPVGVIQLDWFKHSAHMHGLLRPGLEALGIAHYAAQAALDHAFFVHDKSKVFITMPPHHDGVRGFALRWGFHKSHSASDGTVYVLSRREYVKRRKLL